MASKKSFIGELMEYTTAARIEPFPLTRKNVLAQAAWIVGFTGLTAIGAQIEIPHQPVPFTLQSFFVLLSGAFLGARNGAASQLLYICLGAIGLPLFSSWGFGLTRLFGPTGGYLFAFPVAAFAVGYLIRQHRAFLWVLLSMFVGLFIIFSLGTLQLYFTYFRDWPQAFISGFLIFSWWDVVKLISAAGIYHQLARRIRQ